MRLLLTAAEIEEAIAVYVKEKLKLNGYVISSVGYEDQDKVLLQTDVMVEVDLRKWDEKR